MSSVYDASKIEVWVLILRLPLLIHAVRGSLLRLLPLSHEIAHDHHHRYIVVCLLWHLLHHIRGMSTHWINGNSAHWRLAKHWSLYYTSLLDLALHKKVIVIEVISLRAHKLITQRHILLLWFLNGASHSWMEVITIYCL